MDDGTGLNACVLAGRLVGEVTLRELGDERHRLGLTLSAGSGAQRWAAPVVVEGVAAALQPLTELAEGTELVVTGHVRQRFYRSGGATVARTEVVATHVVPARRRKQAERAIEEVRRSLGPS